MRLIPLRRRLDRLQVAARRVGRLARLPVAALAIAAAAGCRAGDRAVELPRHLGPFVFSTGWVSHDPLTEVLVAASATPFTTLPDNATRTTLARYLATLQRLGPRTRPELFTTTDEVVAYLIDAHVAWVLALHDIGGLKPAGVGDLRSAVFPLDGGETTLADLERELLQFAAIEPRLVLCLNPGYTSGPPLPVAALEGYALSWQLRDQAARCGRSTGFWSLDAARRRVEVSGAVAFMPGLPDDPPQRLQRILELVPPPADLRQRIAAACGESLKACSILIAPLA